MKRIKKTDGWCAVLALHFLSNLPEKTVIEVCEHEGFDTFHGIEDDEWMSAAKELGIKFKKMRIGKYPHRLRSFRHKHKLGQFIIGTFDHLFVMQNGIIIDPINGSEGLGRIVRQAWVVE